MYFPHNHKDYGTGKVWRKKV